MFPIGRYCDISQLETTTKELKIQKYVFMERLKRSGVLSTLGM